MITKYCKKIRDKVAPYLGNLKWSFHDVQLSKNVSELKLQVNQWNKAYECETLLGIINIT